MVVSIVNNTVHTMYILCTCSAVVYRDKKIHAIYSMEDSFNNV